jgi:hypothetical protein
VATSESWLLACLLATIALGLVWLWLDQSIASNINGLPQRGGVGNPPTAGGDLPQSVAIGVVGGPIRPAAKFQALTPAGVDPTPTWGPYLRGSIQDAPKHASPVPTKRRRPRTKICPPLKPAFSER